jgi:hypothetical protein
MILAQLHYSPVQSCTQFRGACLTQWGIWKTINDTEKNFRKYEARALQIASDETALSYKQRCASVDL